MSAHTPGDWRRVDTDDCAEIWADGGRAPLALVGSHYDADLIASAPDLLAALKHIVAEGTGSRMTIVQRMVRHASAAIARAEGGAK